MFNRLKTTDAILQIKMLSGQVTDLSAALETAKAEQEASERRMTKILQDTNSRISSNTVICKQPHGAVPCQGRNYSDAVKPTSVSDDYQMRTKGCVSSPTADVVQHQQEQLPPQLPTKLLTSTTTEKPLHPRAQIRPNSQNDKHDTEAAEKPL